MTTVDELRWFLFRKKQAQADRLPPTKDALHHAIMRSHFQMMVWNNDIEPNPELPSPSEYGWDLKDGVWVPVMSTQAPAPISILQLVKCGCSKERCSTNRCQCRKNGLLCTDICSCSDNDDCENHADDDFYCADDTSGDESE